MKLRTTTSGSISFLGKSLIVLAVVVMALIAPIQSVQKAYADQYDDQINTLQQQISSYSAEASTLAGQVATLQSTIAQLQNQQAIIQAQIDLSQAQYDQLTAQIAATQQKIKDDQAALGQTIADMYVNSQTTPLEMLASSKNIGDYLDKQTYRNSVSDQLTTTISQIKTLKATLDKDQAAVQAVLKGQTDQKNALVANQQQQQEILNETQGQEAAYQTLIANSKNQLAQAAAAQQAAIARMGSSGSTGYIGADTTGVRPTAPFTYKNWSGNAACGSDGYPYCGEQDSYADAWALYNRECVSYVTWRVYTGYGKNVAKTADGGGFQGQGMAYQYASSAEGWLGATVDNTPSVGAVAVLPPTPGFAPVGHVMVVESISGDWAHVSQYNFNGTGQYSTMDILVAGAIYVHFQNR